MIALASDHGGYKLKLAIIKYLEQNGYSYKDFGCNSEESCNYADFSEMAANSIKNGECKRGIFVCGTGIGMAISANKVNGIRAAVCSDYFSARCTRLHNDANVLCLGQRVVGEGLALELVRVFIETEFEGERHVLRLNKIAEIEQNQK